jgi:hypothetical protein
VLCELCTDLVIVDELHNLSLATRNGAETSDQLKYFSERIPATFIYADVDVERAGLFAGTRGKQLAGRFATIPAAPFPYGTAAQRADWQALVATLEQALRLQRHPAGSLLRQDGYLHQRTGGLIGSLSHLIREAAITAILDGSERITKATLTSVTLDHAAEQAHIRSQAHPSRPRRTLLLSHLGACARNASRTTRQRLAPTHDAELNAAALGRLAVPTGQAIPSLHQALPALALGTPADGAVPTITWLVTGPEGPFVGCARCLARHGVTSTAIVYLPVGRYLCARHAVWLHGHQQPHLANTPDIVQAQRRHDRLVRRHHAPGARHAYQQAQQIVLDWLERGWHRELRARWDQRLHRLGATNQVTRDNDLLVPAVHPEAVALAGLLVSPWWRSRLLHDSRTSSWPFLLEAGRRLGLRCYPAMSWSDHSSPGRARTSSTPSKGRRTTMTRSHRCCTSQPPWSWPSGGHASHPPEAGRSLSGVKSSSSMPPAVTCDEES